MNNGNDRFNLRLPPNAINKRPTTPDDHRGKFRPPPRSSSERKPNPFRTRERRPVSNPSVETKSFKEFTALLRTNPKSKNEGQTPTLPRGITSTGLIHRRENSNLREPTHEAGRNAERDIEPTADRTRQTRRKLKSGSEILFLGSNSDSTPRSSLKQLDLDNEVSFQSPHHELHQGTESKHQAQCSNNSPEHPDSASSNDESSEDDENNASAGAYRTRLMNLYDSMDEAQKIPQQVDAILEGWTDRYIYMKKKLSKIKSTVAQQRAEIDRSEENKEKVQKLLDGNKKECDNLSLKCTSLEGIIRDEKEKSSKALQTLQERLSQEISSRSSTERKYEKVREELKYLQPLYQKEVSRRESCKNELVSTHEELSRVKESFSEKEREYKSRIELEEAKVSELSDYNDSVQRKVRHLEELISESQTTIKALRTESNNAFATLNAFHEWFENPQRQDSASLSLDTFIQDLCQRHSSHGTSALPNIRTELALPTPWKPSGISTNLQTEVGALLDHFRGLVRVYGKREHVFLTLVKEHVGSCERLESQVTQPWTLVQPMLANIEKMKTDVKDGLAVLQSERGAVTNMLDGLREQLDEVHVSCQQVLANKVVESARIQADQTAEKERRLQNERRVNELTSELQQHVKVKEELSKTSHDLEVCRMVLAETRKDFAKVRQEAECLKISVEQKDVEIDRLKSSLQLQTERMRHKHGGRGHSAQKLHGREDELDEARPKVRNKSRNTSTAKQTSSSRLKLSKRTSVRGDKISSVADRGAGEEDTGFPSFLDNDMGDGIVDDEDWFEDKETTQTFTERDILGSGDRGRFSVRAPPRDEKKTKKSNVDVDHFGVGKKRQHSKSGLEASKSKRSRGKHM